MRNLVPLVGSYLLAVLIFAGGPSARPAAAADEEGFKPIFDGKTLDGWDGDPKLWQVEEGTIVGQTTKANPAKYNTFLIWRGGKPADFVLRAEFRMPKAGFANSGIQFRSWEGPKKWQVSGYQADMDDSGTWTGAMYGENYRGILAARGQKVVIGTNHRPKVVGQVGDGKELLKRIKDKDWNEYEIIAEGNHVIQKINGHVTVDLTDDDQQMRRADGVIAFQLHAGPPMRVEFRNIRLKELKKHDNLMKDEVARKKIVFIAGPPSHGYGDHEHHAGCLLLAKCLNQSGLPVEAVVVQNGWPKDAKVLDGAVSIVVFSDGGGGHPLVRHLDETGKLMKKGVGLACLHYAVEADKGKAGDAIKNWTGGYFETFWSVNPFWTAEFKTFPQHPITRGVKPFAIADEWYYHMRFRDNMEGVTPILTAVPPDSTRRPGNDPHGANPHVRARKGMAEHTAWAGVRPDGGRGFGFTGGHYHWNWANDSFRTLVLNAIAWTAGLEVPEGGVPSKTPTFAELQQNLDKPQPPRFDAKRWQKQLEEWKAR